MQRLFGSVLVLFLGACLVVPASALAAEEPPVPSCAEGPATVGQITVGTPCADLIVAPPGVQRVDGGGGDDTILAAPIAASSSCPFGCRLGVGSQTFEGGPGDDIVFGERGNDILRGGDGNDHLFGGIGDDLLEGGAGSDTLSGGFGADAIDGDSGHDFVRGDGTQDEITDTGPATDIDTLSYATAVTPGFGNEAGCALGSHAGFPSGAAERGVCLDLSAAADGNGNNGGAPNGGGVDSVLGAAFERIVGSPFADYIVGAKAGQTILGGAGGDVLIAGGPGTSLDGGADGDDCVGGAANNGCESTQSTGPVTSRDGSQVSVGVMTPGEGPAALYLLGSSGADDVTVTASGVSPNETVKFQLAAGSSFAAGGPGCSTPIATEALCGLNAPLDSVLVAGLGGNDDLTASGLPATTSLMALGGDGNDEVVGGNESDDTIVDGAGNDTLHGLGGDDAVLNNLGVDQLLGEGGNDLMLSTALCEGDLVDGGEGRDNASWTKLKEGVEAQLDLGVAGRPGAGGAQCGGGSTDQLNAIEDLEGSAAADTFIGNAGPNQLLGHFGPDTYLALAGDDSILANSADSDPVIDCGEGTDSALIDIPHPGQYEDATPVNCETVRQAAPNNFRTVTELPPPPPTPKADRTPPRTRITYGPAKLLIAASGRRRVVFHFTSNERGSRFRCKLDSKPYRRCASPRVFTVGPGKHVVRIDAIDSSGNADPTPAVFRFRVRRP